MVGPLAPLVGPRGYPWGKGQSEHGNEQVVGDKQRPFTKHAWTLAGINHLSDDPVKRFELSSGTNHFS